MKAGLMLRERYELADVASAEFRIWRVPKPVRGSAHAYKYSLAYVVAGECVPRFVNEAGKGDHRHLGETERALSLHDA